jgi:VWFA-related protein
MRGFVRASGIAIVLLALGLALAPLSSRAAAGQKPATTQQQKKKPPKKAPPTIGPLKRQVQLVDIFFSVLNKQDRFVTDLTKKNFEIFDNNIPQQIEFFHPLSNLPLRIGVLLDTSNSIHSRLKFEKNAAFDFLYRNLRPGKDLAFVMTFSAQPQLVQGYTDRMSLLRKAIFGQRAGGGTALYDAIYDASRNYLLNPPPPAHGDEVRRVLIVFSDGIDDLSNHTLDDAMYMAERAGVAIYTISTSNRWVSPDQRVAQGLPYKIHYSPGDKVLRELAQDTGGRSFYPYRVSDLARAFADIGTELRSQYSIAYTPTYRAEDGKYHTIHIEILHEHGLRIHARQGYWAVKPLPGSVGTAGN